MDNEKDTIDKLFTKKINGLNKNEMQKFEKYNHKINELTEKLNEIDDKDNEKKEQIIEKINLYKNKIKKKNIKKK